MWSPDKNKGASERPPPSFQNLPDELWVHVILAGVKGCVLNHRDLCSLSIVSRRLARLSSLDCAWGVLLSRHFGSSDDHHSLAACKEQERSHDWKVRFKSRFEKNRAVIVAAHKRHILRVQSQVTVLVNECHHYEQLITDERQNLLVTAKKLHDAEVARRSSVAVKVWQPQMVRMKQEEVLEQQPTDISSFKRNLQMEICVCKERIERFSKSLKSKKQMLEKTREELDSLSYRPVEESPMDLKARGTQGTLKKNVRKKPQPHSQSPEAIHFPHKP